MYKRSEELFKQACAVIPGGVNSPVRACRNVDCQPLFIRSGKGSHVVDVDGNEFIDFVLSWGPMILGHADEAVTRAIAESENEYFDQYNTTLRLAGDKVVEIVRIYNP